MCSFGMQADAEHSSKKNELVELADSLVEVCINDSYSE